MQLARKSAKHGKRGSMNGESKDVPRAVVEITRGHTVQVSHQHYGGMPFESTTFFCSQKRECFIGEEEEMSGKLISFCINENWKSRAKLLEDLRMDDGNPAPKPQRKPVA